MTLELLARYGELLYGPRWQSELARAIDVSDRTVRRWAAGSHEIPDSVEHDLRALCVERAAKLTEMARLSNTLAPLRKSRRPQ